MDPRIDVWCARGGRKRTPVSCTRHRNAVVRDGDLWITFEPGQPVLVVKIEGLRVKIKVLRVKIRRIDGLLRMIVEVFPSSATDNCSVEAVSLQQPTSWPTDWLRLRSSSRQDRATTTVRCSSQFECCGVLSSDCRGNSWKNSAVDNQLLVKEGRCCGVNCPDERQPSDLRGDKNCL